MGKVRVWIQDLWGEGGGKANDLQRDLSRSTIPQTVRRERKCTVLHQLGWIPHHADTLRPWREKVSLLSAKCFLQNSAKAFRINTGEISAWGTAQLQVEKKKKSQCQKNQTLQNARWTLHWCSWKFSPCYQIKPPCFIFTLWGRECFWTPALAAAAVGPRHSGLSRTGSLGAHCTQTASVKLAFISGPWGSISLCEHSSRFGLWYIY